MAKDKYDRAFIAQGNGDLGKVTDFKATCTNGAKLQHTLKENGSGVSFGNVEWTVSFNFLIGPKGIERDMVGKIERKEIFTLRMKFPGGETFNLEGAGSQTDLDGSLEDASKGSTNFVGTRVP